MNRLAMLQNRYDRLLEANQKYQYSFSTKLERYLNVLRVLKNEIANEQRKLHNSLETKDYRFTLTKQDVFNLTNPL